jgi:hypothetical protein
MTRTVTSSVFSPGEVPALAEFWALGETERERLLLEGISRVHAFHFQRNTAYRNTVAARGVGPRVSPVELPRLLRATSLTFKTYVDVLGTPFAQDRPAGFLDWLAEQVSVDLRPDQHHLQSGYRSLEGLLGALEKTYPDSRLELLTSRGTSGHASIIPRDRLSADLTGESFSLSLQRYLGMGADNRAILMMPKRTRIATARMARSGVQRVGLASNRVHSTVPFPARPDQQLRAGRTYRTGWRGFVERSVSRPVMTLLQDRFFDAQAVEAAVSRLVPAEARGEQVVLFGSPAQLHDIASFLLDGGRTVTLAPGSLLVTAGGIQDADQSAPAETRVDLGRAFKLPDGEPVPLRDVFAMAEANWAAIQCHQGNYHIPPWVHAVTVDDDEALRKEARSTGLLAFFDPFGGGELFPSFFRTADRVTLVRGITCPCGKPGSYLEKASIRRIDLMAEVGWADRL